MGTIVINVTQGNLKVLWSDDQLHMVHLECFPEERTLEAKWRTLGGRYGETGRAWTAFQAPWTSMNRGPAAGRSLSTSFPLARHCAYCPPRNNCLVSLAWDLCLAHYGMGAMCVRYGIRSFHPCLDFGSGWWSESYRKCIWGIPHPYFPYWAEVDGG